MCSLPKGMIYNHTKCLPVLFQPCSATSQLHTLCKLINLSKPISSPANQEDNNSQYLIEFLLLSHIYYLFL